MYGTSADTVPARQKSPCDVHTLDMAQCEVKTPKAYAK
jgi:hypothetical protein